MGYLFCCDINLVETLISMGADINENYEGFHRPPPLAMAAMKGLFNIVRKLLQLNADPNATAGIHFDRTALEGASERGRLDVVKLLLDSGVSIEGTLRSC
ncbi:ankyrin repeat-containing domain protein [Colletotrichum phormii]|uniref:Ankyrin repeat-containing domain protein n=1 Tax=Colletotrichum phormii TaxID=359342 RepID=A0AAI9ZG16_9PEZI|nr:ankyrin repeat-containing domain protein [Colletotrichum phormii]KAK1622791.1 ankyrin repeat-containing domain protein [Colletotrichum phormii]